MVCQKCKNELSSEMIKVNLCWNCGKIIDETLMDKDDISNNIELETEYTTEEKTTSGNTNSIAKSIKTLSKTIMIVGSILNIIMLLIASRYHTFVSFFAFEIVFILSGLLLLGFSEIIQLLQDIKNKL